MRRPSYVFVTALVVLALGATSSTLAGRPDKSWKNWFGHVAAGWGFQQGDGDEVLDDGFYINGGATYWPDSWPIGLDLDLAWSQYDVKSSALRELNDAIEDTGQGRPITSGDSDIISLTANGIWSPGSGSFGFHLTGGIGAYYIDTGVNTTGTFYYPPICSPWYYWCVPGGVGPGTVALASESSTEFGWNVGVGIDFEVGSSGSQLFVEIKYHQFELDNGATTSYAPLVVGYRW